MVPRTSRPGLTFQLEERYLTPKEAGDQLGVCAKGRFDEFRVSASSLICARKACRDDPADLVAGRA